MLYDVFYSDTSISEDELQLYQVEANDAYEAEKLFKVFARGEPGITIYAIGPSEPFNAHEDEEPDSHSCRANADASGFCSVCGAIVRGSIADYAFCGFYPGYILKEKK